MSSDELERRINNKLETMLEAIAELIQAGRIQEARVKENSKQIAALMEVVRLQSEVARSHDERLDRIEKLNEETSRLSKQNTEEIAALREQGKEQDERINALIRIVEGHISHHP
ncbi:MAG TPA: hypothetical protein VKA60_20725 [Blastocatellia bacterium]|nr:hypothetical protein [Blastocatellia bacterium]